MGLSEECESNFNGIDEEVDVDVEIKATKSVSKKKRKWRKKTGEIDIGLGKCIEREKRRNLEPEAQSRSGRGTRC